MSRGKDMLLVTVFVGHPLRFVAIVGFDVVGSAGTECVDPPVVQNGSPFEHPLQARARAQYWQPGAARRLPPPLTQDDDR